MLHYIAHINTLHDETIFMISQRPDCFMFNWLWTCFQNESVQLFYVLSEQKSLCSMYVHDIYMIVVVHCFSVPQDNLEHAVNVKNIEICVQFTKCWLLCHAPITFGMWKVKRVIYKKRGYSLTLFSKQVAVSNFILTWNKKRIMLDLKKGNTVQ